MNAGSLLEAGAERAGERAPALVYGERTLSYGELGSCVAELAARLGSVAGQRVAVVAPNTPALVIGMLAAWRADAVAVPLSARLREYDLGRALEDSQASAAVAVAEHGGYSFRDQLARAGLHALVVGADGEVEEELGLAGGDGPEPLAPEIAAILYTSGTTGEPKGALVTHASELNGAGELAAVLELGPEDVCAFAIPVQHAFGLMCLLATLGAGAAAALVDSTTTIDPLVRAAEQRSATIVHGSPALFAALMKARPEGLASVRSGLVAGAACPPELLERLEDAGMGILNCWGMTEVGAGTVCRPDDPAEKRHTTVGRAIAGHELRIAGGELQVRGPHVTPGYHRRPEQTAAAFDGDWFGTGDLAEIDAEGYVTIAGRAKELVNVAGFNVFPAEVEGLLLTHPRVRQAAVIGVASDRTGEALRAFVSAEPGTELEPAELRRYARSRIAGYKVPYAIDVLDELPVLASGKPDRGELRRSVEEGAGVVR
jgi:acyl-CoA synthetase (AMP-forming)/AMP-acid ligase II